MRAPVRTLDPAGAALSLTEAKEWLQVDDDDQDDLIGSLISAATLHVEEWTGRALFAQEWEWMLDGFPSGVMTLPVGPVTGLTEIRFVDGLGVEQLLDPAEYRVDLASIEARIEPVSGWPATASQINAVTVRWAAGAGCPPGLTQAIRFLVRHWFDSRLPVAMGQTVADIPLTVRALIAPFRRFKG